MRYFEESIDGSDGTTARLVGYVIDDSPDIDPARRRPAVLILPGGGYERTTDREAEPVALRMLAYGYQAFVLRYSCAPSRYPVSTLEVAEAVRRIRANDAAWHVDPRAVIVAGFSAGGHAAALFAESWDAPVVRDAGYAPEEVRPDGLMLGYPVITAGASAHRPSMENLLGPERADDPAWLDRMSLEHHVGAGVPPAFVWTTASDELVPARNAMLFASALMEAGIEVELHVFPEGAHGASLATGESARRAKNIVPCAQAWPDLFDRWVERRFPEATLWKRSAPAA